MTRQRKKSHANCQMEVLMKRKMLVSSAVLCSIALLAGILAGCGGTAPAITSITPTSGPGGTVVAVSGSGFGKSQGSGKVTFANTQATVASWTDTAVAVKVPADLKNGNYMVKVSTGKATSNQIVFLVTAAKTTSSSEASRTGEIEHNTPVQAMLAYLKAHGEPSTGWTFSVDAVSKTDPNWKIDASFYTGNPQAGFWLLHKVNGNWTVLAYGTDWNPQQLGAPADLKIVAVNPPSPTPPPKPSTEAEVIQSYLASKGKPTDNWQLTQLKVSSKDPNWEIIQGTRNGVTDNFLLVWNNMLGNWECLADGGPPWTGVEFKGAPVPSDLNQL
jgi:hypothetical protein